MSSSYTYLNSAFTNAISLGVPINQLRLTKEIQSSNITRLLQFIDQNASSVIITFSGALTVPEITTLSGSIIPNHPNNSIPAPSNFTITPTVNNDESSGFYSGYKWVDSTSGSIYVCADGYKSQAQWKKTPSVLNDLTNVKADNTRSNLLTLSGNLWVSKPITSSFPLSGAMYFCSGNTAASVGPFVGACMSGLASNYSQAIQLCPSAVPLGSTLTLYLSVGTTGSLSANVSVYLNVNGINSSLSTTFASGTALPSTRVISSNTIALESQDRICLNSSVNTNTSNINVLAGALVISS